MIEKPHVASSSFVRSRMATAADLPRLMHLVNSAFSIETFMNGTRTDLEDLTVCLQTGNILVMEGADDALMASIYIETRGAHGYLGMLAVDPAYQCKGLARRIVEIAEEYLCGKGCRTIDIHVLSLRPKLLPIYRRFGFVEIGTEKFSTPRTFRNDERCHCIVMSKTI